LLDPALEFAHDPGGALTVDAATGPQSPLRFIPVPPRMAIGYTSDAIWLRFSAALAPDRQWILEAAPATLDEVTLYSPQANGTYLAQEEGDQQPAQHRALPYRNFTFRLDASHGQMQTFYVRVRTATSMQPRLQIWQPGGLIQAASFESGLYGGYLGMALLIVGFNLIFWTWLRDRLYLVYAGYVVINGLSFALMAGYPQMLLPDLPGLLDMLQKVMVLLQIASIGLFFCWLFRFHLYLPALTSINRMLSMGMLALAFSTACGITSYPGRFAASLALGQIVCIESMAIWLVIRGHRQLAIYLVAFTAFLISGCALVARALGWVDNQPAIDYLPLVGSAVHMVLINIGLAQRARRAEDERRNADQVTLSMSLQNEREMEQRVIQRTLALEKANAALQKEVCEREELQAQLSAALAKEREAMVAQRQFVAMVSHEFRTPLAIIDATAQRVLLQHPTETDTLANPMGKIRRGVHRLTDLIDTFLGEERLPPQGLEVARQPVDLYQVALRCVQQHLPLSNGMIHLPIPTEAVIVLGDAALLALVLSNLIDNAVKYSPPGSPTTVTVGRDALRGWVDVLDYGEGIATADRERVFDKHVRLGKVSGVGGTGLGLHIARNAARRMQGDIELESDVGKGACFRLWVPLANPATLQPKALLVS